MKVLRIILGILGLVLVIFLGAGLVSPSVNYEVETSVDLPVEKAFALFNDKDFLDDWFPELTKIEPIEEKPGIIGSSYKLHFNSEGQEIVMTETIQDWKENERIVFMHDAGNMIKTDDFTFIAEGGKTTMRNEVSCRGSNYIHRCMFAFFKGMFRKYDQGYIDNFKTAAEKHG